MVGAAVTSTRADDDIPAGTVGEIIEIKRSGVLVGYRYVGFSNGKTAYLRPEELLLRESDPQPTHRCLVRSNSHSWLRLAEEKLLDETTAEQKHRDLQKRLISLQKHLGTLAAKEAFRDAIALVRAHEGKTGSVVEGEPPEKE